MYGNFIIASIKGKLLLSWKKNFTILEKLISVIHPFTINNVTIDMKKVKQHNLYYVFLYPAVIPCCVHSWSRTFHQDLNISDLFSEHKHFIYNRKSYEFHWKILHRNVFCETKLKKMNKSNGMCKLCNTNEETIIHLLYECDVINPVWANFVTLLTHITGYQCVNNAKSIVLGFTKEELSDNVNLKLFMNFILYIVKWCLWKHRNDVKYGQAPIKCHKVIYETIVKMCKKEANLIMESNLYAKCDEKLKVLLTNICANKI